MTPDSFAKNFTPLNGAHTWLSIRFENVWIWEASGHSNMAFCIHRRTTVGREPSFGVSELEYGC